MKGRKAQMDVLVKKACITGGLCIALTACGSQVVSDQTGMKASDEGQSRPEEVSFVSTDQEETSGTSSEQENVWEGYAQEHTDLTRKYPEWFDETGRLVYPFDQESEGWAECNIRKREKKSCIPDEIAASLDTLQLLAAVADYPCIDYITLADGESVRGGRSRYHDLKQGIENVSGILPAMGELMKREDLIPAAYSYYKDASYTKQYDGREDYFSEGNVASRKERYQILLAEYILCTKEAYDMLSEEERETVAESVARIEQDRKEEIERDEKLRKEYPGKFFCALTDPEKDKFTVLAYSKSEEPSLWEALLAEQGVSLPTEEPRVNERTFAEY